MRIEISFARNRPRSGCGVDIIDYDDEFKRRLMAFLEHEGKHWQSSELRVVHESVRGLSGAIERVCPEEGGHPFQIVINVGGEVDNSAGPHLY